MRVLRCLLIVTVIAWTSIGAQASEFDYKTILLHTIKMTPNYDYENFADPLMQLFRPAVWQSAHNDEFEKNAKRAETSDMVKKMVGAIKPDEPIVLRTAVEFGEYDFAKKAFALHPFAEGTYFPVQNFCCAPLPTEIRVAFSNPDFLNGLPMEQEAAKSFLNRHKLYGNVDRGLVATVEFRATELKSETELVGEITKVVITDPKSKDRPILTVP